MTLHGTMYGADMGNEVLDMVKLCEMCVSVRGFCHMSGILCSSGYLPPSHLLSFSGEIKSTCEVKARVAQTEAHTAEASEAESESSRRLTSLDALLICSFEFTARV